jgi:signal transduction histidine kinase
MAQSDAIARGHIRLAYLVLACIVVLIILLLARQARIVDYTTLYQRLKEVDQMKDDFVSMAAHELRSPLTAIRGYIDIVKDSPELSEKNKGFLGRVDQSARQLNTLVGDILDVARLQEGRMSFSYSSVDATDALSAVVESFTHPAEEKGLTLTYERTPLPPIRVDPDRFRQVIINLVGNAIKYTPKGGVKVAAGVEGETVVIRVSDTGMGISAEEQKKLFQKFYRIRTDETRDITGTGLGLWITASIVRTMKGSISVESIKGKGSDFIVSFPVARS